MLTAAPFGPFGGLGAPSWATHGRSLDAPRSYLARLVRSWSDFLEKVARKLAKLWYLGTIFVAMMLSEDDFS